MDDNPAITKTLLYQAAVGLPSADFYVPKFLTFEEDAGPRRSWNWAPFFFGLFWFVYRQMYLSALVVGFIAPISIGFVFMGALSSLARPHSRLGCRQHTFESIFGRSSCRPWHYLGALR
jgi:hypothetical protein